MLASSLLAISLLAGKLSGEEVQALVGLDVRLVQELAQLSVSGLDVARHLSLAFGELPLRSVDTGVEVRRHLGHPVDHGGKVPTVLLELLHRRLDHCPNDLAHAFLGHVLFRG